MAFMALSFFWATISVELVDCTLDMELALMLNWHAVFKYPTMFCICLERNQAEEKMLGYDTLQEDGKHGIFVD